MNYYYKSKKLVLDYKFFYVGEVQELTDIFNGVER